MSSFERKPTLAEVMALPKALLHDHVDGGLRPKTIIEIADDIGYDKLPTREPEKLAEWFQESCNSGSLVRYLETFDHTIAVMQRREDLIRVARECVVDLARDGVVYAEVRGAPELFTTQGLSIDQVVEATLEGYRQGMEEAASEGKAIRVESILCALRQNDHDRETARAVVKYRGQGVVGFDIAGPEDGFPPTKQLQTFEYLRRESAHFTIHAGEACGLPSIREAIQYCGAERLGHGVRIIEDIDFSTPEPTIGHLAAYIRDRRIPLEICPTSNIQTGISATLKEHPIGKLSQLRFRVTVNTDNRLMSRTSLSNEIYQLIETFDWTFADVQRVTVNALKSAFIPFEERLAMIEEIIKPGFLKVAG